MFEGALTIYHGCPDAPKIYFCRPLMVTFITLAHLTMIGFRISSSGFACGPPQYYRKGRGKTAIDLTWSEVRSVCRRLAPEFAITENDKLKGVEHFLIGSSYGSH